MSDFAIRDFVPDGLRWLYADVGATSWRSDLESMTDDDATELEDVGDLWLTFWVVSILADITATALLSVVVPLQWSLVGAFPIGISAGWLASRARSIRRFVSYTAQLLFFWV
ncbi:MAG: hypothetical protein IPG56_18060 [Caulobacteraceae bacterium]|nr:hypothetical protein [Caulobacteraceae bacterium]